MRGVPAGPARHAGPAAHREAGRHGPHVGRRGARVPQPAGGHQPGQRPAGRGAGRARAAAPDGHDPAKRPAAGAHRGRRAGRGACTRPGRRDRGPGAERRDRGFLRRVGRAAWRRRPAGAAPAGARADGALCARASASPAGQPAGQRRALRQRAARRHPGDDAGDSPRAGAAERVERRRAARSGRAEPSVRALLVVREPLQRPGSVICRELCERHGAELAHERTVRVRAGQPVEGNAFSIQMRRAPGSFSSSSFGESSF